MESYALKDLTLRLFKTDLRRTGVRVAAGLRPGLAGLLRDCEADLAGIIAWAREHSRRLTVRLVKGAYWDYETVIAQQRRWPVPVFATRRRPTRTSRSSRCMLLENDDTVDAGFRHAQRAQHRPRAGPGGAARAGPPQLRVPDALRHGRPDQGRGAANGLPPARVLPRRRTAAGHGLPRAPPAGEHVQRRVPGQQVRQRRQPGGVAQAPAGRRASASRLPAGTGSRAQRRRSALRAPELRTSATSRRPTSRSPPSASKLRAAIQDLRQKLGQRHPLVINHKPVSTPDWLPSLNPANQKEVVGYAAQAGVAEAEAALAPRARRNPSGRAHRPTNAPRCWKKWPRCCAGTKRRSAPWKSSKPARTGPKRTRTSPRRLTSATSTPP